MKVRKMKFMKIFQMKKFLLMMKNQIRSMQMRNHNHLKIKFRMMKKIMNQQKKIKNLKKMK